MTDSFELSALIYFLPIFILMLFFMKASHFYFTLYKKKKSPKYPILPQDVPEYFSKDPVNFFKVYPLTPFFMWKIIFERQKDKELNDAAKKVRLLVFIFIGYIILQVILFIIQ